MKICFFGVYNANYSRNEILLSGLKAAGVEVIECKTDWKDPKRYSKLWKSLRALNGDYDFVYAAYPAPIPAIIAKFASRKPVVCDAFYSMFDSVVNDRREVKWWHPKALKLLMLDWLSVFLSDIVITDTDAHKKYWSGWWGINASKIYPVYLGVNDKIFFPKEASGINQEKFLVHFHGTYIPLQGVDKIIEAAALCLDNKKIQFRFIGSGAGLEEAKNLAKKLDTTNIEFVERRVSLSDLNSYMSESQASLGIFGDTKKAKRVIPNKVYEGLAAGQPMVTMDTPAIREIFSGKDMVLGNNEPQEIANAIDNVASHDKMRRDLARNGHEEVSKYFPISAANSLIKILKERKSKNSYLENTAI